MTPRTSLVAALAFVCAFALLDSGRAGADVTFPDKKASMGEVVEVAMQPLEADPEWRYMSSAAGTTPIDVIASDPLTADSTRQTIRYAQDVTIENMSSTASVCMCSTTHATACSAVTCACRTGSGAPNLVPPGKSLKRRYAGTRKLCVAATAAAAEYQVERVVRKVGDR